MPYLLMLVFVGLPLLAVQPIPAALDAEASPGAGRNWLNTETVGLAPHGNRLFGGFSQWMAPNPTGAELRVKDSANGAWRLVRSYNRLRVLVTRSFLIPAIHNGGKETRVLVFAVSGSPTEAGLVGTLRDDAADVENTWNTPLVDSDIRSIGQQITAEGVFFYAGARPGGIYRGRWNPAGRIDWNKTPEYVIGANTDRVLGIVDCAGTMYASNGNRILRRRPAGAPVSLPQWTVWTTSGPDVSGSANSGWRGPTCSTFQGRPVLLSIFEGGGIVGRFALPAATEASPPAAEPVSEIDLRVRIAAEFGVPASTSVGYVIGAYNELLPVDLGGAAHVFGVEWSWRPQCIAGRTCSQGPWDDAACFFVRRESASGPAYTFHCLDGPDFRRTGTNSRPIRNAQAFVAIRTLQPSPFESNTLLAGGYDCNSVSSEGTAWIARFSSTPLGATTPLALVSAAGYRSDLQAPDSIVSLFGVGLAGGSVAASGSSLALELGGRSVRITDSLGRAVLAPLYFVSPTQINFVVPRGLANGRIRAEVLQSATVLAAAESTLGAVAPGLFTVDGSAGGAPSALLARVPGQGPQEITVLTGPIRFGPASEALALVVYGSGWRNLTSQTNVSARIGNTSLTVQYAGAQSEFPGLDQMNLILPRSLAGSGRQTLSLSVDGVAANSVSVTFQ